MKGKEEATRVAKDMLVLAVIAFLACAGYLIVSGRTAGLGFPLDDAWIHQTFARNLADGEGWSFQSGQPSGGSTGPAWGALLSLIHLLGLSPLWGSYLIGFGVLWGCAVVGYLLTKKILPDKPAAPLIIGAMISLEWHLVWASLSGMETILLALLILLVFLQLLQEKTGFLICGILIGLSAWIRPDGLTLVGPAVLVAVMGAGSWKARLLRTIQLLAGLALLAGPYFLFNKAVAGEFWPNTFFAKQAEYAFLRGTNYLQRFARTSLQLLVGVGAVLLPGLFLEGIDVVRRRDWVRTGMVIWVLGFLGIYAWRLPVVYQHGRYLIPAMPVYLSLAAAGWLRWLNLTSKISWERIVSRVVVGVGAATMFVFWLLGARAFARDVGVIQTEMVETALWVNENTPESSTIGAHDIGALGYFGERRILDLAGLVSPDVIPFIRDEARLAQYLDLNSADYLVTFPGWYPNLVQGLELVHTGQGDFVSLFGMEHMAVYDWK